MENYQREDEIETRAMRELCREHGGPNWTPESIDNAYFRFKGYRYYLLRVTWSRRVRQACSF